MRHLFLALFILMFVLGAHAQQYEVTKDRTGKKMLKGFVSDSLLLADTTSFKWFVENGQTYAPSEKVLSPFISQKDSVSFLCFFGTWCPDSHYVIPRFFKILESAGFDKNKTVLFALDRTKNDAAHFAANFNILHVPTIVVLKNGKEVSRVVEYGTTGKFDEELAAILNVAK